MNKHVQENIYGLFVIIFAILLGIWGQEKLVTIQEYGKWFVGASLLSILFIGANLYQKSVIDRLVLVITMFWTIGAVVYLANVQLIADYYDAYTSLTFFLSLLTIGIVTTFFSKAGFIGELSVHATKV